MEDALDPTSYPMACIGLPSILGLITLVDIE